MSQRSITRKLTSKEAALIVKNANSKYLAYETKLSGRIEAWCIANFNPEMENQITSAFDEILKAATSGKGNTFSLETAEMIIKRHNKIRGLKD
jgi:hypothetical protein